MITVLVIEDDEKLNKILCAHLREHGYSVVSCLSAMEAFDKMIDVKTDIILSDIMMPEVDGFKMASLVREQDKTIPILFMSSRDDLGSKEKGFRIGIDDYMELWEQKNIRFEADLEEITVCYDESILELVWNNLFSNAIKFTGPGGSISVKLKAQNEFAVVSVSDSGCGMNEETQKHLFDKFYQGDNSRSQEGNGLGLALVKRTLNLLGGTVTVESRIGEGSVFTVSLKI